MSTESIIHLLLIAVLVVQQGALSKRVRSLEQRARRVSYREHGLRIYRGN